MKTKPLLLFICFMVCSLSYGQTAPDNPSRNNVYLELLGNGGVYSLNYERRIKEAFGLRFGFAAFKSETLFGEGTNAIVTVPVMGNFLFGPKKSKLELGGGFLVGRKKFTSALNPNDNTNSSIINLTGVLGYRYQPSTSGFMFRAGLTPFYALKGGEDAYPDAGLFLSGGVSVGYSF